MSDDEDGQHEPMGWWVVSGSALMSWLRRCANGEDPDLVYAEAYVNSTIERPGEDGTS